MSERSKPNPLRKSRIDSPAPEEESGELFPDSRPRSLRHKDNSLDQRPTRPSVYLWLCCEGWMKVGPFEWLRFDDERQAILGPDGREIAKKTDGIWRVPEGRGAGMAFSNPTITMMPVHPHKNRGSHPLSK